MHSQIHSLRIDQVTDLVEGHFRSDPDGLSLLPLIAVYSLYQCLTMEIARYKDTRLIPEYNINGLQRRSIESIRVNRNNGDLIEVLVVRHHKAITSRVIEDTFYRFRDAQMCRYCFLTTVEPLVTPREREKIRDLVQRIETQQTCEVIIDGVLPTIRYYLRTLSDPSLFWHQYWDNQKSVPLATTDPNKIHLKIWQSLLKQIATND